MATPQYFIAATFCYLSWLILLCSSGSVVILAYTIGRQVCAEQEGFAVSYGAPKGFSFLNCVNVCSFIDYIYFVSWVKRGNGKRFDSVLSDALLVCKLRLI